MKRPTTNKSAGFTAFIYLRLSVDKEDGKAQSIDAQRTAITDYCEARGIRIAGEFVDMGLTGQTDRRPDFRRMVALATGPDRPVNLIVMYMFSRIARNMRLFFNTLGDLEDAGVRSPRISARGVASAWAVPSRRWSPSSRRSMRRY